MPAPLSLRIKERYMAKRAGGLSQQVAADAVGISVRSAQRIDRGELQPEAQLQRGRHWRTRADPLAEVWESVLVPMLEKAPQLEPQTLLLHLERTFPGQEWYRRKRTLQRRVEQWRALHGPAREVMFLQEQRAGVLGISDFTVLKGEPITICGEALEHRLFHFRLPFSGWCHVAVIHGGESFVALAEALQNALAHCGGVPAEHRTDSLSACFRNRDGSYAGDHTSRYRELCAHLGVIATRNNRGVAHENGAIEGPHRHWKTGWSSSCSSAAAGISPPRPSTGSWWPMSPPPSTAAPRSKEGSRSSSCTCSRCRWSVLLTTTRSNQGNGPAHPLQRQPWSRSPEVHPHPGYAGVGVPGDLHHYWGRGLYSSGPNANLLAVRL